jgi:hypothetical protein
MVYNKQNYWVFGLFPSPGILENRKHDVSETGSVSVLRWRGKQIQFPKRRFFYTLEYWKMDRVKKTVILWSIFYVTQIYTKLPKNLIVTRFNMSLRFSLLSNLHKTTEKLQGINI